MSNYYSPDAVEEDDDDDDENYGQEQDMTPHGGRTPSGYSSAKSNRSVQKPEECKKWKARPDKRDLSDTVSYQDGRSSGSRSIPSASSQSIQSRTLPPLSRFSVQAAGCACAAPDPLRCSGFQWVLVAKTTENGTTENG